ncbi:MAG: TlpA disulfide reductase family protein [Saccharospirillum sp.]|uniref:TlpA disulfide reductase family protein n=1 Tax=Saccharospirillum sp. TaxID=2033801 RepID=UPI003296C201
MMFRSVGILSPSILQRAAVSLGLILLPLMSAQAADITPVNQAELAPMRDFNLSEMGGGELSLVELQGQVVLVDFWASWCGPCRESFPWMNTIQQRYQDDGLVVLGINLDQDAAAAESFLKTVPANFTLARDPDAHLPEAFGLIGMPSSYLLDRQGRIRATHTGFHASRVDEYEASIQQLLAE